MVTGASALLIASIVLTFMYLGERSAGNTAETVSYTHLTAFLFPWAVVMRDMGPQGLISILFFFIILVLGLAYAGRKGALEWK